MFMPLDPARVDPFYTAWWYPGGERGVRLLDPATAPTAFVFRVQHDSDLVTLAMLLDCYAQANKRVSLTVPYLPYARQDRVAVPGDPNAIEVIAKMIANSGAVTSLRVVDAHSAASEAAFSAVGIPLISLGMSRYLREFLVRVGVTSESKVCLVIPDKGARAKLLDTLAGCAGDPRLPTSMTYVECDKVRDPTSGKLLGFELLPQYRDLKLDGYLFVIADDICDGGGTFHGVADVINAAFNNPEIMLFTSHGIYSKGLDGLMKVFTRVGSTDSFLHGKAHDRLITIPL